jgi:hypothetical protein
LPFDGTFGSLDHPAFPHGCRNRLLGLENIF